MKQFFEKTLKVYSHEFGRFMWISAIFLAIFFVTAIFRNYVDTAFLKRLGPDYIPWMLVISAVLTMVVLSYADRIARSSSDSQLMSRLLILYAGGAVLCFFLVKAKFTLVYPILYQLLHLLDSILLVYLWNIAGDLFDARQGKRLFPLITAAQVLGTTLGSFATRPITHLIGEDAALLIFAAVFLPTGLYLLKSFSAFVVERAPKGSTAAKVTSQKRIPEVPGIMREFPIVRYLIVCGLVPNILLPIFSYQFSVIANDSFASEQGLITFLSVFRGCTTLFTFFILFAVGRLYSQMGLPNASLVHPVNFAVLFSSLAAFFNIYVASYGQFSVILIQRAIAGPVNKILFNVIPRELQLWSRTFIRGTVLKVGMLIGSLSMIVLKPVMDARDFAYIGIVFGAYWVFETLLFRKEYKRILKQVIVEGKIDYDAVEAVRTFDAGGAPMGLESSVTLDAGADIEVKPEKTPAIPLERALKLLDDPLPSVRAEAAQAFVGTADMAAARKLIHCLEDPDETVRNMALEALIEYPADILPFLEASLLQCTMRGKQSILEVIRLSPHISEFEMSHLLGRSVEEAYSNLLVIRQLQSLNRTQAVDMLNEHLLTRNDEILRLVFYGLWVYHADMRLMYQALKSDSQAVAVEMVETTVRGQSVPYLLPLIDDVPLDEKIAKGRKLFNLVERPSTERLLSLLTQSADPVTRMLSLYVIGDLLPSAAFVPVIDECRDDSDATVREMAEFARAKSVKMETPMPDIIQTIDTLRTFDLFAGMGTRELHAVATLTAVQECKPGDIIIRAGEPNNSIYLILKGKIVIFRNYQTPEQEELRSVETGGYLGFVPMFDHVPPANTSVAVEDSVLLVLPQNQFHEIMRVYPQIGLNLLALAARFMRQMGISA
jgi:CRP-like cAMP-binding protein/ATP/ADP translocase